MALRMFLVWLVGLVTGFAGAREEKVGAVDSSKEIGISGIASAVQVSVDTNHGNNGGSEAGSLPLSPIPACPLSRKSEMFRATHCGLRIDHILATAHDAQSIPEPPQSIFGTSANSKLREFVLNWNKDHVSAQCRHLITEIHADLLAPLIVFDTRSALRIAIHACEQFRWARDRFRPSICILGDDPNLYRLLGVRVLIGFPGCHNAFSHTPIIYEDTHISKKILTLVRRSHAN